MITSIPVDNSSLQVGSFKQNTLKEHVWFKILYNKVKSIQSCSIMFFQPKLIEIDTGLHIYIYQNDQNDEAR